MCDLTNSIFHDEEKARRFLETERWPDGVICPFCNSSKAVSKLNGKSMGPGWYYCNACDQAKFTVRTGSSSNLGHNDRDAPHDETVYRSVGQTLAPCLVFGLVDLAFGVALVEDAPGGFSRFPAGSRATFLPQTIVQEPGQSRYKRNPD